MSLGSVLTLPQLLTAPQRPADERPPTALVDVLTRLAREAATGGRGLEIAQEELVASIKELAAEVEPRLEAARARLQPLTDSLVALVDNALGAPAGADGFGRAVEQGRGLTEALATVLGGMTTARVNELVGTLFDVLETDLGLTEVRLHALLAATIDRIATRLQADYVAGDSSAYNRYALGAAVRELRGLMGEDLGLPPFDRTTVTPLVTELLQELKFDARMADAAGVATRVKQGLTSLESLEKLFPGGSGPSDVIAANGAATNGAATNGKARAVGTAFGAPTHLVAPGLADLPSLADPASEPQPAWYVSWLRGELVEHVDPTNNPDLAGFDFDAVSAETMEALARHSAWIARLAEAALHASSIRKGDFLANAINIGILGMEALIYGLGNAPIPRWARWVFRGWMTAVGGLERSRFNDAFGLLLILSDLAEAQLYTRWVWLARESMLSILTLANNRTGRANHNQIEGLAHLFGELGNLFMALILARTRKKDYGIPAGKGLGSWPVTVGYLVAGVAASSALTLVAGALVSAAFSGRGPDTMRVVRLLIKDRVFWHGTGAELLGQIPLALITHVGDFYIYYYMFAEGQTEGGTLSGQKKPGITLPGYPDRTQCPYRLPWEKGKLFQCAQGNHGLWSHTPFSVDIELYAYDFSLDHGDEVLAMRDGIVWEFEERHADDNNDNQNELIIFHDAPTPVQGQDFDEHGTPKRTFTSYLHGKKGGVTAAFGSTPTKEKDTLTPATPRGTRVTRGKLVMLANNTGRSAYNHLHVTVKPVDPLTDVSASPALKRPDGTDLTGSQPLSAVAPVLQAAIRGAVADNQIFSQACVLAVGDRLVVAPGPSGNFSLITFANAGSNTTSAVLKLTAAAGATRKISRRSGPHAFAPIVPASPKVDVTIGTTTRTATLSFPAGTSLPGPLPLSAIAPVLQAAIRSAASGVSDFANAGVAVIDDRLLVVAGDGETVVDVADATGNTAATALLLTGDASATAVLRSDAHGASNPTLPASATVALTVAPAPADYTIPFVFGDDDIKGHGGVPRSGVWYDSDNVKVV